LNVVLIGFSGSGKSAVGRLLAERLGWAFVDTDLEVERVAGLRIHEIFSREGEAVFRRLERQAVEHALDGDRRIVAVGGGAAVDPANRRVMTNGNLVVLLDASIDALHRRLTEAAGNEPRPMLGMGSGGEMEAEAALRRIAELKAARDPIYRETANLTVSTNDVDLEEAVSRVAAVVEKEYSARGVGER
jgi:shikimate kinase